MEHLRYIFVIGAHRSGTSLLTSFVASLGADVGSETLNINKENARGFWENRLIVELHDEILRAADLSWDILWLPAEVDFASKHYQPYREKAKKIIASQFNGKAAVLIKDPRLCFLMPFWQAVLQEVGAADFKVILLFREPGEVVASQYNRANDDPEFHILGYKPQHVYLHWYASMRSALEAVSQLPSFYLKHKSLLEARLCILRDLSLFLEYAHSDEELVRLIDGCLDLELYRSRLDQNISRIPFGFTEALARELRQVEEGAGTLVALCSRLPSDNAEISSVVAAELQQMYGRCYKKLIEVRHHLLLHMQQVKDLDKNIVELESIVSYQEVHIRLLENSRSRKFMNMIRRGLSFLTLGKIS